MSELHHESGPNLDLVWYETEEEIVILHLRAHSNKGTGSATRFFNTTSEKRCRALNVTSQVIREALLRRGWRPEGHDLVRDSPISKECP